MRKSGEFDRASDEEENKNQNQVKSKKTVPFVKFEKCLKPRQRPELQDKNGYFFKFTKKSDVKLVRHTLELNGFREILAVRNNAWSIMWSNLAYRSDDYESLNKY